MNDRTNPTKRLNDLESSKFFFLASSIKFRLWASLKTFRFWELLESASKVTSVPESIFFFSKISTIVICQSFAECKVSLADGTVQHTIPRGIRGSSAVLYRVLQSAVSYIAEQGATRILEILSCIGASE
jgi:hypothetical protein